jgi:hypothetical protein
MYDSNCTTFDVTVKLDIAPDEAKNHKLNYWKLKEMDKLEQLYIKYEHSLSFIISKFFELEARNISLKDLSQAIDLISNLPKLRYEYQQLTSQVQKVYADYNQRQDDLRNIEEDIIQKRIEFRNTEIENSRLVRFKDTNQREIFSKVLPVVREIEGNENTLLYAALIAILRVIRKYPDYGTFLKNIETLDSSMSSHILSNPNQCKTSKLIAEASDYYHHLIDRIVEKVIEQTN